MKRVTTLTAALLGAALLASAAPASSEPATTTPSSTPAAYRYYVACGLAQGSRPSHRCPKRREKGAFFRSNLADVFYTVCVRFPTGKHLCAKPQKAEQGTLYVNKITSNIPGKHRVTWFVARRRVGIFYFTVLG
jgi:ABC-type sugar transport system substrate-binding protein